MLSINARVMLAASLLLALFLATTGWALDRAYQDNAIANQRQRLQAHIYGLLAATDVLADGRLRVAEPLPEPRLSAPNSTLVAGIFSKGKIRWIAPSMAGKTFVGDMQLAPGATRMDQQQLAGSRQFYVLGMGVFWESDRGGSQQLSFVVGEDAEVVGAEIAGFRRYVVAWLGGAAMLLLIVQAIILRWSLSPLRRVSDDLRRIERGETEKLAGRYPAELRGLTDNLNALIANERASSERNRNALADLAHSLKTPLAVMRSGLDAPQLTPETVATAREQIMRMSEIVDYQLKRAASANKQIIVAPVPVFALVEKIVASLQKVYADKAIICDVEIDEEILYFGDEGDLYEMLGNVLDNAFRYGFERVRVHISENIGSGKDKSNRRTGIQIKIEDDGSGIPMDKVDALFQRGVRLDEAAPSGNGIGLAVVREIVEAQRGSIDIGMSRLGGASVTITLP